MVYHYQYSGKLKSAEELQALVIEVEDICDTLNWPVEQYNITFPGHTFSDESSDEIFGIFFTPPQSEPVFLTFDLSGKIINPFLRKVLHESENTEMKVITVKVNLDDENMEPVISEGDNEVDITQVVYRIGVSMEVHDPTSCIQIMELIRYLSDKYLADFTMSDDAGYWNSKNPVLLAKRMKSSKNILDKIQAKLEGRSFSDPEDFLKFIRLLGSYIQKSIRDEEE